VPEWSPEHVVDEDLAWRLIAGQCFEPSSLELLGEGWDNTVWLVDDRWAFRFPRREIGLPGFLRELDVLGELAPQLPLRVPVPVHVGGPAFDYPWPFYGAEFIAGSEPADVELSDAARDALGHPLGRFLRALHDADVKAPLPVDPMRRSVMASRVPRTVEALLAAARLWAAPHWVFDELVAAERIPTPPPTAIVHGDLHLRHVLLIGEVPCGVIDWGDVCRGDPCIDLALYWFLLTPRGRDAFLAAYGEIRPDQLAGARVLSWFMCASLAVWAHEERRERVLEAALDGLRRTT
jgi:aminoglycoside phosphotransferase (APT) family kinase protein